MFDMPSRMPAQLEVTAIALLRRPHFSYGLYAELVSRAEGMPSLPLFLGYL